MQVSTRAFQAARTLGRTLGLALLGLTALAASQPAAAAPRAAAPAFRALTGHIPPAVAEAQAVSALDPARTLSLALTLPLRHTEELADLLRGLADPNDARYGQYLTPQEFAARFGPTQADYDRTIAYARSMGLSVVATHPNRTVLDVAAPAGQAERAFGLHLLVYQSRRDGRYFFAPDAEPRVPAALAAVVSGIVGLDNAAQWQPHLRVQPTPALSPLLDPYASPFQTGSGPGGGLTPSDIKKAYSLTGTPLTGTGQTLGLFELDGYKASDIAAYESYYGLPAVPLTNVLVDGYSGATGKGAGEVTLDIELQAALAPGATGIIVYEGPNSSAGVVDTYTRIATDNLAKSISTSWGAPERSATSTRSGENSAFQQMAAQGQSIFAASGDSGAYDNKSSLSVDDPASQPYMTGVGGTSLTTSGAGGPYSSEKTWNGGSISAGGGGGGISTVWTIPSYQSGIAGSAASKGSATMRNVPDVSLDADPNTGYSVYYSGGWYIFGGTSCAAPLWSAFTALVNQQRAANGLGTLGFANTPLYNLAKTASYSTDFHDIADSSTNLYYPAVTGYDDATGLGTFNGLSLLTDLSGSAPAIPAAPTGLKAIAGNAQVALTWTASTGATSYTLYRATTSGSETLLQSGLTATSYTDTGLTNGTPYFYQVAAVNSAGTSLKSAEAGATPQAPIAASASFLGTDTHTQGSWKGVYGSDGYTLSQDASPNNPSLPSYAQVALTGNYNYTWNPSTADTRALQKAAPGTADRLAACWYSDAGPGASFDVDLNLTDGQAHRVSLYCLDWDSGGRTETITLKDAGTGAVLDTQTASGFRGGEYLSWTLKGHVTLHVEDAAGSNAVLSALFFGAAAAPATASASFLGTDTSTQGSWKGVYGSDGYTLSQDASPNNPSLPSYAQVALTGNYNYTWNPSTADTRALLKAAPGTADRLAACWYSDAGPGASFDVDVNLTDGQAHRVSLYCLDWDGRGRSDAITVKDAGTGAVLDTQTASGFGGGEYLTWTLKGHVTLHVVCANTSANFNAVLSALFFDTGAAAVTASERRRF